MIVLVFLIPSNSDELIEYLKKSYNKLLGDKTFFSVVKNSLNCVKFETLFEIDCLLILFRTEKF